MSIGATTTCTVRNDVRDDLDDIVSSTTFEFKLLFKEETNVVRGPFGVDTISRGYVDTYPSDILATRVLDVVSSVTINGETYKIVTKDTADSIGRIKRIRFYLA